MSSLILHHYEGSPFSEKMRLIFGAKNITWQSVIVPSLMPKPDVMALTGGYRRTPFLQVGGDIYCDTALMCKLVDQVAPQTPLYPAALSGLAEILAQWADSALFWTAVPYTIQPISIPHMFPGVDANFMKAFATDRAAMTPNMTRPTIADAAVQVKTYLARLDNLLHDGRAFLLGGAPCIADFSTVQSLWFMRRSPPIGALVDAYPAVLAWYQRMVAFGHGSFTEITSAGAIAIAAAATGFAPTAVMADGGFAEGDTLNVTPTDYAHDAVSGRLVGLTADEVVVERVDARAGTVRVHFPRIGFQLRG